MRLVRKDENQGDWLEKFDIACKVHAGEMDSEVQRPADVKDFQTHMYEVFQEFALLTEGEFLEISELSSLPKGVMKAEPVKLKNALGELGRFFLVSMKGLDCSTIHSLQRVRFSCRAGICMDEMLVIAAKQLQDDQAQTRFEYNLEQQAETLPLKAKALKDRAFDTVASLKAQVLKEAAKKGLDLTKSAADGSKSKGPARDHKSVSEDEDSEVQKKKVVKASSSRLQENQRPKAKAVPKRKAEKKEDDSDEGVGGASLTAAPSSQMPLSPVWSTN